MTYTAAPDREDEVEELYRVLRRVQAEFPQVTAVTSGAIVSNYQRHRVEHVCARLGLRSLAFLWHRDGAEVLRMAADVRVGAILVKTASMGLCPRVWLGRTLQSAAPTLAELHDLCGAHMAGEGGEFETIVLNCPLMPHTALRVTALRRCIVDDNVYSPSGHAILRVTRVAKSAEERAADAAVLAQLRAGKKVMCVKQRCGRLAARPRVCRRGGCVGRRIACRHCPRVRPWCRCCGRCCTRTTQKNRRLVS